MLDLMVDCSQNLPGKIGYPSSPVPCSDPISALFSVTPCPPGHSFTVSIFLPVCQVFDALSPVQPSSLCLCYLPVHPTFLPFHRPATPKISSPTVHLSHTMPHLIPLSQLIVFPCGGGVEEDEEHRVGHGSNPTETLFS